jgi:hypothetical protein
MGLVTLIFLMPFFYTNITNNVEAEMMKRELKEIADYVSSTVANLYFLVNSTNYDDASLEKELIYLPSDVENSIYVVEIVENGGNASRIAAYLRNRPSIRSDSWIAPGLKVDGYNSIESDGGLAVAGCNRNGTSFFVWIKYR